MSKENLVEVPALDTVERLKAFTQAVDQCWLVMDVMDLIDSLDFPEGHEKLQHIIAMYAKHRATIESGNTAMHKCGQELPIMKSEVLTITEMDRLVRHFVEILKSKNPDWALEDPPL